MTLTYGDVLVSTSVLILSFFPGISFPVDCFLKFCFSHKASLNFDVVCRDFADLHTNLHASFICAQGNYINGLHFNTQAHIFFSYSSKPNTGFVREQNAQFCVELNWTRIVSQNSIPKDHFLRKIVI